MIKTIIEALNSNTFYKESELIEIAKGKYHLKTSIKSKVEQTKRAKKWQS